MLDRKLIKALEAEGKEESTESKEEGKEDREEESEFSVEERMDNLNLCLLQVQQGKRCEHCYGIVFTNRFEVNKDGTKEGKKECSECILREIMRREGRQYKDNGSAAYNLPKEQRAPKLKKESTTRKAIPCTFEELKHDVEYCGYRIKGSIDSITENSFRVRGKKDYLQPKRFETNKHKSYEIRINCSAIGKSYIIKVMTDKVTGEVSVECRYLKGSPRERLVPLKDALGAVQHTYEIRWYVKGDKVTPYLVNHRTQKKIYHDTLTAGHRCRVRLQNKCYRFTFTKHSSDTQHRADWLIQVRV